MRSVLPISQDIPGSRSGSTHDVEAPCHSSPSSRRLGICGCSGTLSAQFPVPRLAGGSGFHKRPDPANTFKASDLGKGGGGRDPPSTTLSAPNGGATTHHHTTHATHHENKQKISSDTLPNADDLLQTT